MIPSLFAHPFSAYCWKVLIALWENDVEFDYRRLDVAENHLEWAQRWPLKRMPLLLDAGRVVPEATIIIEHLQQHHPGAVTLIPTSTALDVRLLDRLSDNYLMAPLQTIVFDRSRPAEDRDAVGVGRAHSMLDTAYAWWDEHLVGREWASPTFSLADCAAAPALFYADWVHPIPAAYAALRGYRTRLLARPSIARAVDEARPFRSLFPFGDPGRD